MSAKVVQLKDKDGISIFPINRPETVIFDNGQNLSYVLDHIDIDNIGDLKFLESTENVDDVNPPNITFVTTRKFMSGDATISIFPE